MEKTNPIKRSKELAPLSREHHDGLLFCWKLKQGLANGTAIETLVEYTRWYWINHLQSHFKDEERVFTKFLPAENLLLQQMLNEHARIRNVIHLLDKDPGPISLQRLAEYVNDHIRFEERKLFVYVETNLTPRQMSEIYKELPDNLTCDSGPEAIKWKDEFWMRKPIN